MQTNVLPNHDISVSNSRNNKTFIIFDVLLILFSCFSTFWNILFLGVRILTEAERIIEYTEFR